MRTSNPLLWPKPPAIWSYGIAVLSVPAVLFISWWPAVHLRDAPVSLFLCAVILSAWFGGAGPGLLATALSTLAFYYYFLPPTGSFDAKPEEIPRLLIFIVSALFVGSLSVAQRRVTESLRHARDDLKVTVQHLQNINEALQAESRERKSAEESLRRSEGYLAEAQRLSHTGSWASIPATGEIKYFSEECYRVLGFDPHGRQPRYEAFFERVHPDDQAKLSEAVEKAGRDKTEFELDYRFVRPSGEIRDIHVVGHPVLSPSSDLVEFVGTVMDITERKRAEEERERLRQAQADLARVNRVTTMGELTASVAHEINQPIAAAVTNAKTCLRWLTRDYPDVEEARAAAMRIVNDGTRAAEIIKRIRLLFKKETSERELVDVSEVIQEMVVLLRGEAMRNSILVRTQLEADTPQVMADRVQLQQVLMNLILNGMDAMKDAIGIRELIIKSQRGENDQVLVSVSDTGVGLPPEQAERIFAAFFTTKPHGTGMGLSISRSIVESHGGRLWAADNAPCGASFCFSLPAKAEAPE
jgi:PAS domain S-box-containing protein